MYKHIVIFICIILLTACSSAPSYTVKKLPVKVTDRHIDLSNTYKTKQILNQQYKDWQHVPYRMGGMSKKGIDCSGLVYLTYQTKFGFEMPRTTEYQSKVGQAIAKDKLKAGDLVFFKTGVFTRHVGMYVGKGKFIHVSSSKGVMMSNLNASYWKGTYWKARRLQ